MRVRALGLMLVLCACAQAEITAPPIMVTPTNASGAVGLDVYARDRSQGNPVPRFRGQNTVQVRTFGSVDGSGYGEISGATCELDSGLYRASIVTPANVAVPNYGPDSPSIFVRCIANDLSGSVTVNAVNFTAQQRSNSAIGTGILGAIVIGAVAAANNDPENDQWGYPQLSVQID